MEIFTVTEEVYADYGILTLEVKGSNFTDTREYDLTPADYDRALHELVDSHLDAVYANSL